MQKEAEIITDYMTEDEVRVVIVRVYTKCDINQNAQRPHGYVISDGEYYYLGQVFNDEETVREEVWRKFLEDYKVYEKMKITETIYKFDDAEVHLFTGDTPLLDVDEDWLVFNQARNIKLDNIQKYIKVLHEKKKVDKVKVEMNKQGLYCIWYIPSEDGGEDRKPPILAIK